MFCSMNTTDQYGMFQFRKVMAGNPLNGLPQPHDRLRVNVVADDITGAEAAIESAVALATDLEGELHVILAQVVPYPLPLESPVVPFEFTCERVRNLVGAGAVDCSVHVCLCRDAMLLLNKLLPIHSIAVVGPGRGWFRRRRAEKIARTLEKNGCHTILARRR
jgi:hypothetical protein